VPSARQEVDVGDFIGLSVSPLMSPPRLRRRAIVRMGSYGYNPWMGYIQDLRRTLGPRPL